MAGTRRNRYGAAARREAAPRDALAPAVRTDPIRVTLDLSPAQHRKLKAWCNSAAVELELSQVALAPVLRILGELLTDGAPDTPGLSEPLRASVRRMLQQQSEEAAATRTRRRY